MTAFRRNGYRAIWSRLVGGILGVVAVASPSWAAEPAYVGTWGIDAAQCKVAQEQQGAPMIVSAHGFDQHEAHCTFTSVKQTGASWSIKAACSVEGDMQTDSFRLTRKGETLVMSRGQIAQTFIRCS